jgi:hypothetical protein
MVTSRFMPGSMPAGSDSVPGVVVERAGASTICEATRRAVCRISVSAGGRRVWSIVFSVTSAPSARSTAMRAAAE